MTAVARARLHVTGTVQGVGFRPFLYRRARALGLAGFVRNDPAGVLVEVEGAPAAIAALARAIVDEPPPLARVEGMTSEAVPVRREDGFRIEASAAGGLPDAPVSADVATCAACLAEVDDPADRRYRYPFTNCTDCGPRYTIVRAVPYDRAVTTMAGFTMCAGCRREYDDPADRRFHAQPNACPACGPTLSWRRPDGTVTDLGDDALAAAAGALAAGAVVALKGIGGYHLAADASDAAAVASLRRRKARDDKPFAVMVATADEARRLVALDGAGLAALASPARPVVIAPATAASRGGLAAGVAPGLDEVGVLLPYTALHHLLLAGVGRPLVMTSGNLSDEPIAHTDGDAVERLGPLVDGLLTHDRAIHVRCDDSVVRAAPGGVQWLRRSRGAAPAPVALPVAAPVPILAVGAELKSTIAVARGPWAVVSHHLGDLEHLPAHRSFLQAAGHLPRLGGVVPEVVAHDLHPEYLSTKFAVDLDLARPPIAVQHHHAHVAACLVEHGRTGPVLGVAFDGLGYGPDGTLWGGEFLVADLVAATRVAHLRPVALPGGAAAIREPWRMAVSWLATAAGTGAALDLLSGEPAAGAVADLATRPSTPATTSAGRLFDAVAVLLGGRRRITYEAQAAIGLEALARTVPRADAPHLAGTVTVDGGVLDPAPLLRALIAERAAGVAPPVLAAAFHETLGRATAALAADLAGRHGLDAVVLTGGVFQNARLAATVTYALRAAGVPVLTHGTIPPNDGGISVGQAAVAAARLAAR